MKLKNQKDSEASRVAFLRTAASLRNYPRGSLEAAKLTDNQHKRAQRILCFL